MTYATVAVTLREPSAVRPDHQRQVEILRWRPDAQPLLKQELSVRRAQQIVAADDLIDSLPRIVDHHGKLITRQPLLRGDEKITAGRLNVVLVLAHKRIIEGRPSHRRPQAQRKSPSLEGRG